MTYEVLLSAAPRDYVDALDEKSRRIVTDNLRKLEEDPHPQPRPGSGDTERLTFGGEELCRLHVGRTHTAFYVIEESTQEVRIVDVMPIDEVHDRYGV